MAHLNDGALRRMVDDPDARTGSNAEHLEACADCRTRFETVSKDAHSIATLLAVPDAQVDVSRAFERVRSAPTAQPRLGFRLPVARPGSRPFVLAFAAVIAVGALITTVIAQNINTYAPTTVQPVPVTMADMQALSQLADYGTVTWTKQPNLQVSTTAADAASVAGGLQAPVVSSLPAGVSTNVTYGAMPQAQAVFTFSAAKAAAAAASHGQTLPMLPAGMDGAQLTVVIGPAVGEIYGNLKQGATSNPSDIGLPQLVVGVSNVPTATSTQVTVQQMIDYLMSLPGISPELKAAVSAIKDPSKTLPIPIPVSFATSRAVTVQGVQGVALGDNTGVGAGVIWVKNGNVYVVAGTIKQSDAINIANNLK